MKLPKNLLLAGIPLLLTSSILAAVTPHKPVTTQVAGTKKTVAQPSAAQRDNFEQAIRPLLAEHCGGCHASTIKKGGVILDTAAGVRAAAQATRPERGSAAAPAIPAGAATPPPPPRILAPTALEKLRWSGRGRPG